MSHPIIRFLDRAKETTSTTGTGTITLGGAVAGFVAIGGIGDGNSTYYTITEGNEFEVGIGTYTSSGDTLSRDQVFASSNSGSKITLAGSATVFITYPADKTVAKTSGNYVGIGIDPEYQLQVSGTGSFNTVRWADGTTQVTSATGDISTVSGLTVTNASNIASTGSIVDGRITTNTANITTNTTNIGINATNIVATGAANRTSIVQQEMNLAEVSGDVVTLSGDMISLSGDVIATGATNAECCADNAADIATVSGIAAGKDNYQRWVAKDGYGSSSSIHSLDNLTFSGGGGTEVTLTDHATDPYFVISGNDYLYWTATDGATSANINTEDSVKYSGAGTVSVSLATGNPNVVTISGSPHSGGSSTGSYDWILADNATTTTVNSGEQVQFLGAGNTSVLLGGTDNRVVTISGSGGVAGPNKAVQFNDNGVHGGEGNFTYDKTGDGTVIISGTLVSNSADAARNGLALSIGSGSLAGDNDGIAIGYGSTALGGTAIGVGANTWDQSAVALGHLTDAPAGYTSALGWRAQASFIHAQAIGTSAQATTTQALAIGNSGWAQGVGAIAIGYHANRNGSTSDHGIAIGYDSRNNGNYSITIGTRANASSHGIAIGSGVNAPSNTLVIGSTFNNSILSGQFNTTPVSQDGFLRVFDNRLQVSGDGRVTVNNAYTFPIVDSVSSGHVLTAYANGVTSWDFIGPGGDDTAVQFNDNGSFSGVDEFVWDRSDRVLGIAGTVQSYKIDNASGIYYDHLGAVNGTGTLIVDVDTKTSIHPYYGQGSLNAFFIDGKESPAITLYPNVTYKFDQSDPSNNTHPLRFYYDAAKTTAYTTNVTTNGTAGDPGAYTQIEVVGGTGTPSQLFYQCSSHAYMGNYTVQNTTNLNSNAAVSNENGLLYTFPTADASLSGYVLTSNADGTTKWAAASGTAGSGGGAPLDAQYVTLALDGGLSDERVLVVGTGLQLTDGGANSNVTVDASGATTSNIGVVQLQDSATDGTVDKAITPNAVYDVSGVLQTNIAATGATNAAGIATNVTNIATNVTNIAATGATNAAAIVTNTTNIAATGATNAAAIATNVTDIATNTTNIAATGATNAAAIVVNTTNIAATGATNAAAIATNTTNIATNVTNIAATGATNAAAISTNTTNIAATGATNAAAIATNTTNIATNVTNIASTGATNAAAISTNTTNIAATGATNAAAIATNTTNIATNVTNIAATGATNAAAISTNTTNIAATGATNAADIVTVSGIAVSKDNYQYWTSTDGSNNANIETTDTVKYTGAGTVTVSLASGDPSVVTISGSGGGGAGTTYTAGTGLTLVGSEFNMYGTGALTELSITEALSTATPLTVKGAASQSADLTQWQNSAGTTLASMGMTTANDSAILMVSGTIVNSATDDSTMVSIGSGALSNGNANTITIGKGSESEGAVSIAIGIDAKAQANDIAIGGGAIARGGDFDAVAIGGSATATVRRGVAIGPYSHAQGNQCTAIGSNSYAGSYASTALGYEADAGGEKSIAIGDNADVGSSADYSIAIGTSATVSASCTNATVLGFSANAVGSYGIAIGPNVIAPTSGLVIGAAADNAILSGQFNDTSIATNGYLLTSTKFGINRTTAPDAMLDVTNFASTDVGVIVQGAATQTADLQQWQDSGGLIWASVDPTGRISASGGLVLPDNTPVTTTNTLYNVGGVLNFNGSGVNGAGGGSTNAAGSDTYVQFNDGGTDFGGESNFTFSKAGSGILKVGTIVTNDADAARVGVVSIGSGAYTSYSRSIAIGYNATTAAGGDSAVSIGASANGLGVSIGPNANASQNTSTSVGSSSDADGFSVAVGYLSQATSDNSIAIGNSATATNEYNIAIGSVTEAVGGNRNISIGYSSVAGSASLGGSVVVGADSNALGNANVVLGPYAGNASTAYNQIICIGPEATALGDRCVAIGRAVKAPTSGLVIGVNYDNAILSGQFNSSTSHTDGFLNVLDNKLQVSGDGSVKVNNQYTFPTGVTASNDYVLTAQTDGSTAWAAAAGGSGGGISWDGSTANGVATYKDSDEATVESNLTFDGNTLTVGTGGIVVPDHTPGTTTNTLYNVGGVLNFNGSGVNGAGGGGGTPGGSDTQVQFNGGGDFEGDSALVWNSGTNVLTISGHLAATTKSFLIDHPTEPDKKLQYASLEGPENGVYVRGHTNDSIIDLPDYWTALVDQDSITVQVTAKDFAQPNLFVSGVLNNKVYLISEGAVSACYNVSATRKDVAPLEVEI